MQLIIIILIIIIISLCPSSIQLKKTDKTVGKRDWNGTKHRIPDSMKASVLMHSERRNENRKPVRKILCYGRLIKAHALTFQQHSKCAPFNDHAGTIWELAQRRAGRPKNRGSIHTEQETFLFTAMFRSPVECNQTPIQRVTNVPFTKIRWSGREADHSPILSAE